MNKLTKMSVFKEENKEALTTLQMAQIQGGKLIGNLCHTETHPTNWDGCSDTETWIYDGQTPIKGTVTYSDGSSHQMYP